MKIGQLRLSSVRNNKKKNEERSTESQSPMDYPQAICYTHNEMERKKKTEKVFGEIMAPNWQI